MLISFMLGIVISGLVYALTTSIIYTTLYVVAVAMLELIYSKIAVPMIVLKYDYIIYGGVVYLSGVWLWEYLGKM